jgi:phosphoserine phosphatase/dolichol kinase
MTSQERRRLIIFDVDGVIIRRFWLSQIFARFGLIRSIAFVILGILYEARLMEVTSFMRYAYRLLRGAPKEWLLRMTDQSTLIRGVLETIQVLRKQGHIVVLISSGIPDFVVHKLATNVGAHFAAGIRVDIMNGLLTGHIAAMDCLGKSKMEEIRQLIELHQLQDYEVVTIANDRNNIPLLDFSNLPIGFRPDRVVRRHVRAVVTKPDLRALIPIITLPSVQVYVPRRLGQEIIRQLLHASAVIIPLLWLDDVSWHSPILFIVTSICIVFLFSEIFRSYGIRIPLISTFVQAAGREDEIERFVFSPLFFAIGVILPLFLFTNYFPYPLIAVSSVCAFLIGDSFSTVGGLLYGTHHYPFNKKKTLEGTITGFSLAFLLLIFIVTPLSAILCSVLAAIIELLPLHLDDNLSVPLLTSIFFAVLQFLGLFYFI